MLMSRYHKISNPKVISSNLVSSETFLVFNLQSSYEDTIQLLPQKHSVEKGYNNTRQICDSFHYNNITLQTVVVCYINI